MRCRKEDARPSRTATPNDRGGRVQIVPPMGSANGCRRGQGGRGSYRPGQPFTTLPLRTDRFSCKLKLLAAFARTYALHLHDALARSIYAPHLTRTDAVEPQPSGKKRIDCGNLGRNKNHQNQKLCRMIGSVLWGLPQEQKRHAKAVGAYRASENHAETADCHRMLN